MFKSSDVANMNPSSFSSISWILGIENGCLFILLFSSLKSVRDLEDPSGLLIVNMGHAHSDLFIFLKIPSSHNLFTSSLSFTSWECGTGYGFAWYGCPFGSFRCKSTGSASQVPTVPSNRCLNFRSRANSFCCSSLFNSAHSCVIFSKSVGQYLASNIAWILSASVVSRSCMNSISCSRSSMCSSLIIPGSSIGVVALSHSIKWSLNQKVIPSSLIKSLPMIISYWLVSLSVLSTKAVQLMFLFSWKAGSVKCTLHVLVVLKLPAFVLQLDGLLSFCFSRCTNKWWIRVAPQPVSNKILTLL